jgi:hypothetical protein
MMLKKAALLVLPLIGVPLALQATADPAAQTRAPWSIRINSGGPAFTDPAGRSWLADQYFTGGTSASTTKSISGTSDQTMYQDERYGLSGYRVPVPGPGIYVLTLHLTDTYATDPGQRVFSVSAEGQPVVPDLDLVSTIGPDAAYDVTVPVRTEDDYLDLQFSATANSALINGLEISSGPVAPSRSATTLTSTQRPLSAVAGSPVSCTGPYPPRERHPGRRCPCHGHAASGPRREQVRPAHDQRRRRVGLRVHVQLQHGCHGPLRRQHRQRSVRRTGLPGAGVHAARAQADRVDVTRVRAARAAGHHVPEQAGTHPRPVQRRLRATGACREDRRGQDRGLALLAATAPR